MPPVTDTIAALATPAGTAALALLRVSGPDTEKLAVALAGRAAAPRRVRHADYRALDGELLDEVLLTFFRGPRSYTGEDSLELSCHGNPFIAQKILEDLFARGCRPAGPGEFTQRAFLNGRMDLSQAEAVMDVIHARSERALAAAHRQLRGSLGRRMDSLVQQLLTVIARVEAYIDFPEEDLPPEARDDVRRQIEEIARESRRLLATSHYGEMLRGGIKTVILGPPNAGKSSLLNRLLGRERALVSPEPGTTRDFIEETLMVGPHCLRLVDTAGFNPSPTPLEQRGIEKTLESAANADLFLFVTDATDDWEAIHDERLDNISVSNSLRIYNKMDLLGSGPLPTRRSDFQSIGVSAKSGFGIDGLVSRLGEMADGLQNLVGEDTIAISARHASSLREAETCLAGALSKIAAGCADELLASDLRGALEAFGAITGRVDHERVLDALFGAFCIGK